MINQPLTFCVSNHDINYYQGGRHDHFEIRRLMKLRNSNNSSDSSGVEKLDKVQSQEIKSKNN